MKAQKKHITVFEHESLRTDRGVQKLSSNQLQALQNFYGEKGVPYFSLIHNGVKFCEYVGVIQVADMLIEVLPKADKDSNESIWRSTLIGMLKAVGSFDIHAPSSSSLKLKSNSILDLYFELFISEVEYLLQRGFIKRYRKVESNTTALKGSLHFTKHIQQNLIHQERFYVRHINYDINHQLHFILYKTIVLLKQINRNVAFNSRIGALLLYFPQMPDILITDRVFEKIAFNRKNGSYRKAIEIAQLLLLNYHPDVAKGRNNVLALMFDMNLLWEQFVYISLKNKFRANNSNFNITPQSSKFFWKPEKGNRTKIRPDIVINNIVNEECIVLDTKWKNLDGCSPTADDLRQMYVYHEYYKAKKVALIYPGVNQTVIKGRYLDPFSGNEINKVCAIIPVAVNNNIKEWQMGIYRTVIEWYAPSDLNSN